MPCSECEVGNVGDVHNSIQLVFEVCTQNPFDSSTFFFVTPAINSTTEYILHINCSAGCMICQNTTSYALDHCTDSTLSPLARVLLTETTCTGGLDPINYSDGFAYVEVELGQVCDEANSPFTVFSFGNMSDGLCVPFLANSFARVSQLSNGTYLASLFCDETCTNCTIYNNDVYGCQVGEGNTSWLIEPLSVLSSCLQPPPPPTPPRPFKLSTGEIVGIAAGGAVVLIVVVAVTTHLLKKRRRKSFTAF